MRRLPLVFAAVLGLLALALPAGAETDVVDRYEQLRSTAKLTLTPGGHSALTDITGGFVTVDALGNEKGAFRFFPYSLDNARQGPNIPGNRPRRQRERLQGLWEFPQYEHFCGNPFGC
jgi:hypothetical protein